MRTMVRWCLGAAVALAIGFGAGQVMAPAAVTAATGGACADMLCSTGWPSVGDCVPGGMTTGTYCMAGGGYPSFCWTGECGEDPPCETPWDCEQDPESGGDARLLTLSRVEARGGFSRPWPA